MPRGALQEAISWTGPGRRHEAAISAQRRSRERRTRALGDRARTQHHAAVWEPHGRSADSRHPCLFAHTVKRFEADEFWRWRPNDDGATIAAPSKGVFTGD